MIGASTPQHATSMIGASTPQHETETTTQQEDNSGYQVQVCGEQQTATTHQQNKHKQTTKQTSKQTNKQAATAAKQNTQQANKQATNDEKYRNSKGNSKGSCAIIVADAVSAALALLLLFGHAATSACSPPADAISRYLCR